MTARCGAALGNMAAFAPFRHFFAWSATRCLRAVVAGVALVWLAGCATPQKASEQALDAPGRYSWDIPAISRWEGMQFPNKTPTRYTLDQQAPPNALGSRSALHARADSSASMLRTHLDIDPEGLRQVRFSWLVPALIRTRIWLHDRATTRRCAWC